MKDDGVAASALAGMSLQLATIKRLGLLGVLSAEDVQEILHDAMLELEVQRGASPNIHDIFDQAAVLLGAAIRG